MPALSATSSLGSVISTPETIASLAALGQTATTSVNSVTTAQTTIASLDGLGQTATSSVNVNKIILRYYHDLTPRTSASYTQKTPRTSASYTDKKAS